MKQVSSKEENKNGNHRADKALCHHESQFIFWDLCNEIFHWIKKSFLVMKKEIPIILQKTVCFFLLKKISSGRMNDNADWKTAEDIGTGL